MTLPATDPVPIGSVPVGSVPDDDVPPLHVYDDELAARPTYTKTLALAVVSAQELSEPSSGRGRGNISAAEESVVGSLLIGAEWSEVAGIVRAADYGARHRLIITAIEVLAAAGEPRDVVTVCQQLTRTGHLEAAGGLAYLRQLAYNTPTPANILVYARVVRERSLLRHARELIEDTGLDTPELVIEIERDLNELKGLMPGGAARHPPIELESAAAWADHPAPGLRDWVVEGLIPGARVTSFLGNGGLGKTIIAGQIAVHVATGRPLFSLAVNGGPVVFIACEDERAELERRIRAASAGELIALAELERLFPCSRDGMDNLLCTFDRDRIVLTPFYHQLEATVAQLEPRLLILDTAADLFAGDYVSTPHVRQFIKVALGGLCVRYGCAVLLVAHPSAAALSSGDGGGFSTAWSNSVRSRLFLRRPRSADADAVQDRRILEVKKANYAADGLAIPLLYQAGYFIPDPEPLVESAKATRAPKSDTRLAVATLAYFRQKAPSGEVLNLGIVTEHLQTTGALPPGKPDAVRKRLQRTLGQLEEEKLIVSSKVPRGYRLVLEAS